MHQRRAVAIFTLLIWICGSVAAAQTKGTFQAGINYPAGPATVPSNTGYLLGGILPLETHTGDFNGDGKPDVVVAASCGYPPSGYGIPGCPASQYAVIVYLSNGDGTFGSPIISGGPAQGVRSIAVGDFNGDGKLDIAAVSDCTTQDCSSGSMTILLGNGDGTFTSGPYYQLGGIVSQANTITVGDLNGDGRLDIVAGLACYNIPVNGCSVGSIEVFLGNGDGTFQSPNNYTTTGNTAILPIVADFNKDGKADVLAATGGSALVFFPGNGDGTLGTPSSTPLPPYGAQAITTGDFNGDGNLDVAVGAYVFATVALGNGDGTFQNPTAYNLNATYAEYAGSIIAADMNGDGKPDLVVGAGQGGGFNTATLLFNDGTGNFSNISTFSLGGVNLASVGVADFNGDGKNDIVLASFEAENGGGGGSDGTLSVLLGNGDGTMRSARYINERTPLGNPTSGLSVAAADFNGDGFQDLTYQACSTTISSSCGFTLLLANGAGGYQPPALFTAPVSGSRFLAVGDFNHDGMPDVAVLNDCDASCTGTSVSIFLNIGKGTFADPVVYEGGDVSPLAITTGDFNGDGKLDIAILQYCGTCSDGEDTIGVLLGNGDGTFQPVVTMHTSAGNAVYWLAAADFNGDGKTDLVLAENTNDPSNPFEGSAQILLSNGDGTFSFGAIYDSGGGRSPQVSGMSVTTGDVNGDGRADIVIGNLCEPVYRGQIAYDVNCANGSIGVLLGNGDGTFQSGPTYVTTDGNMYAISLADVNADGKLDAISSTATGMAVFFGNGDGSFQPPTVYAALEVTSNVQLAIADLNGDGGLDIVQPGTNGQLAILYNQGFSSPATTVLLQSSPLNSSTWGQTVTFTATVTAISGTPTGTVTFNDGSTVLGSPTLVNGAASLSTSELSAGTHSISATYSGDTNHSPSTAGTKYGVNKGTTSLGLASSPNPSYVNQTVYFSPQLTSQYGGSVAGTVTYMQGTTTLAVLNYPTPYGTAYTTTGTRAISAVYSGDNDNLGSTSAVVNQVVKALPAPTTTALTTSGTPSFVGQSVTFTATVTSTYGAIPDGQLVTFFDGTTTLASVPLTSGVAAYTTSSLNAASHVIKATYAGNATFKTSTTSLTQVVKRYPSTTAISSSLNPSNYGQSVTFTATVTSTYGPIPDGELVTFFDGTATLASVPLAGGVATYATSSLSVASHTIKATYAGDATLASSTKSLSQVVKRDPTTTVLGSSLNPSNYGQSVTFTATVTSTYGPIPDGELVTFFDGAATLASVPLATGVATYITSSLNVATHTIKATYAGDKTFASSTKSLSQVVKRDPTTTVFGSSLNPSNYNYGQSVTFTATVTSTYGPIPDADLVTFFDGTTTLASVPLASGVATYTTSSLSVANHVIKATYAGDATFASSTKSITQVVKP